MTNDQLQLLGDFAALVTAAAALATAFGTFLTVRQMRRQMTASYRPELAFAKLSVSGKPDETGSPFPDV